MNHICKLPVMVSVKIMSPVIPAHPASVFISFKNCPMPIRTLGTISYFHNQRSLAAFPIPMILSAREIIFMGISFSCAAHLFSHLGPFIRVFVAGDGKERLSLIPRDIPLWKLGRWRYSHPLGGFISNRF
jgi:hypothetical protein